MKNIVIIGAGQLGSRHLQGVCKSNIEIKIEVVDPSELSRDIAKQRYEEVENNNFVKDVFFFDSIAKLSDDIDLVIIATNADVRAKIITELLTTKNVKNMVLEKVLFQTVEEYTCIDSLLEKTKTECWVNHPRRMFPFYQKLKQKLKGVKRVSYSFQGGAWGLGCNGLHFIDHLSYLVESTDLVLDSSLLDNKIYNAKREGYIEFNGLLTGQLSQHIFSLYSTPDEAAPVLTISSDRLVVIMDEAKATIRMAKKENNWEWEEWNEKITFFQSELSDKLIQGILLDKKCSLPTYKEAMRLHVPFIECLLNHVTKVTGKENKTCLVT